MSSEKGCNGILENCEIIAFGLTNVLTSFSKMCFVFKKTKFSDKTFIFTRFLSSLLNSSFSEMVFLLIFESYWFAQLGLSPHLVQVTSKHRWAFSVISNFLGKCNDSDRYIHKTLTIDRGKYHCTADLLFDWFGFDRPSKTVVHSAYINKLYLNDINRRSVVQWYFPLSWCCLIISITCLTPFKIYPNCLACLPVSRTSFS